MLHGIIKLVFWLAVLGLLYWGYADWLAVRYPNLPQVPKVAQMGWPGVGVDLAGETTVYKWENAQGQWTYSTTPPQGGHAQTLKVNHATNVLPSVATPAVKVSGVKTERPKASAQGSNLGRIPAIQDAKKVENVIQKRNARLNDIIQ